MPTVLESRVSDIEQIMRDLAHAQLQTEQSLDRLSREMAEFKDEMAEFKNEMAEFKNEMTDFKDEMTGFKGEMAAFKDETREANREMNRRWGELANKMGTLVEDIVSPSFIGILRRYFNVDEPDDLMTRRRKRHPSDRSRVREFDVIAVAGNRVFVNETKSSLRMEDVARFAESYRELVEFYPEYADYQLIPFVASLSIDQEVIDFCTSRGIYAMQMGDSTMDVANFQGVSGNAADR
jgi:hypothetical protein